MNILKPTVDDKQIGKQGKNGIKIVLPINYNNHILIHILGTIQLCDKSR